MPTSYSYPGRLSYMADYFGAPRAAPAAPAAGGGGFSASDYLRSVNAGQAGVNPNLGQFQGASTTVNLYQGGRKTASGLDVLPALTSGAAGGPGGAGGGGLWDVWQKSHDEAKAANKARAERLEREYDVLETQALGYLEGAGESERADIGRRWLATGSSGVQDLISRGLGGTSLRYDLGRAVTEGQGRDVSRLNERLQGQRLGTMTGIRGRKLGMIENIEETYPDYGLLAQLMGQYGQGLGALGAMSEPKAGAPFGGPNDRSIPIPPDWSEFGGPRRRRAEQPPYVDQYGRPAWSPPSRAIEESQRLRRERTERTANAPYDYETYYPNFNLPVFEPNTLDESALYYGNEPLGVFPHEIEGQLGWMPGTDAGYSGYWYDPETRQEWTD